MIATTLLNLLLGCCDWQKKPRRRRMMDDDSKPSAPAAAETKQAGEPAPAKPHVSGWGSPTKDEAPERPGKGKAAAAEDEEDDVPRGRRRNLRDLEEDETEMVRGCAELHGARQGQGAGRGLDGALWQGGGAGCPTPPLTRTLA